MLVDGDREMSGALISSVCRYTRHGSIGGSCSSCLTFATTDASIGASLIDTVAVLAPRAWCSPGFSGESSAEWTRARISDLPANPGNVLLSGRKKMAGPDHSLLSDIPGQTCTGLLPKGGAYTGASHIQGLCYLINGEVTAQVGLNVGFSLLD